MRRLFIYVILFGISLYAQNPKQDSLFSEARFYYYTFNFDSAANCIELLLKLNPYSAKAYELRGNIYRRVNKLSEAIEMYKKGFSMDSTELNMIRHIATVQIDLGNLRAAIRILMDLIKKDNKVAEFYNDLGDATFKIGDTTKAIYYFSKSKKLKHNYTIACENLGEMYLTKNLWREAIDELLFVKMLNHWYPIQNKIKYGSIMAESEFKICAEQQPNEGEAHYYYSFSLLYKYGIDEALEEIEKAIELNNKVKKYYLTKAFLLYNKKEYEKVIDILQECLNIYTDCWECYNILAKTFLQLSDTSKALERAKESVEIDSSVFSSLIIIAEIYNRNKEFGLAIQSLDKALNVQPYIFTPKLFYELAFAYYGLSDYKKAWGYVNAANKIYSLHGQQTLLDENIREEIDFLIAEIWKAMD